MVDTQKLRIKLRMLFQLKVIRKSSSSYINLNHSIAVQ